MRRFMFVFAALVCSLGLTLTTLAGSNAAPAFAPAIDACVADFTPAPTSPETVGDKPEAVAVGDFNGDGKLDLGVANFFDDNVTILLGDGTGNFTPAPTSPEGAGNGAESVAAADFNGDGKLDLAVANFSDNNVTILLGDGTGNFSAAATSPEATGAKPDFLVVGDFNRDGLLDLATTNFSDNNVTILLGDGTGNFSAAGTSPEAVGGGPQSVAVGDFNRNGIPDLAVANSADDTVTILLGDGTGNFTAAATSPESVGEAPQAVAVGDFNLDGEPDLAVANAGADNNVSILLGDGTGNFTAAATSPEAVGDTPIFIAVSDFNLDGKPDLAVANYNAATVSILLGDGTGNFSQPATSPEAGGNTPQDIGVGDFNGDGKPDLAVPNTFANTVTILLNGCPSNACRLSDFITPGTSPEAVGDGPQQAAVGDFNRDGKLDLAVPNSGSVDVSILLGDGTGNFTAAASPSGFFADAIGVGDFNHDGKLDLAVVDRTGDEVTILLGDGTGAFTEPGSSPEATGDAPTFVAVGDLNGDGKPDLTVANAASDNVSILLGDGTGNFTAAAASPENVGTSPTSIAMGDFNRDGKLDLAVANLESDNVSILLGDGTGNFTAAASSPETAGNGAISVAVGDFNRDGRLDLAVANFTANNVTILLGDGTGNFTAAPVSPVTDGAEPQSVVVGDFNLDGKLDLAVESSNNVTILLGDGTGAFVKPTTSPEITVTNLRLLGTGDFNRDGRPDLAAPSFSGDNVGILLNACAQPTPVKPAVWRTGSWLLRNTFTTGPADLTFGFGLFTDRPLMCDWDGNGSRTPGVFRNGTWHLRNTNSTGAADLSFSYGLANDIPICGDWDGDGDETVGIVRAGTWHLRNSNTAGVGEIVFPYGILGDIPMVGDWNGDGVDTAGIKRGAQWHLRDSNTAGVADLSFQYGIPTDVGVVGDWNNDGVDTVGIKRGIDWHLRNSNTAGVADVTFQFGVASDTPLVWR